MDEEENSLNRINELALWGADQEVISRYVLELEKKLVYEAGLHSQASEHAVAIKKLFWALLLRDRSIKHDELMAMCLHEYTLLAQNPPDIDAISELQHPQFQVLKQELRERWKEWQNNQMKMRFTQLDSEPSLLEKQFRPLIETLDELPLTSDGRLLDELRIAREKEAQKQFIDIRKLLQDIALDTDPAKRRQRIQGEVHALMNVAADFVSGEKSDRYFEQIQEYIAEAERLLIRSELEIITNEMNRRIMQQRDADFEEFKMCLYANPDGARMLAASCKALRGLRGDERFEQVKKILGDWAQNYAETYYRRLAYDSPDSARGIITGSMKIIKDEGEDLPEEIKAQLLALLPAMKEKLGPPPASQQADAASKPPPNRLHQAFGWLKRLFKRGDKR